ncbi:hypothetical protein TKK_0015966 [Trichogramma kaykai]|uniref:Uncharacterized protein n=2 Tax=Trichogramma TaxID=7490 RepID=A0ABD2W8N9_9HYME
MGRRNRQSFSEMPLRKKYYESAMSVDRFSEHSLHGNYLNDTDSNMCKDCMSRIPYATLIATIMCCIGVGVFCGTMYRGATLVSLMISDVFHIKRLWLEAIKMIFAVIGASMAALGFMILCVGCLATGATRTKVYRAWRTRVGGRISCAFFMTITYILQIFWTLIFAFLVIATFVFHNFCKMCDNPRVKTFDQCIDFTQFNFMFPNGTREEDMKVCGQQEVKLFCKDYSEPAILMFILATIATILVLLSLVHFLMCLSANYAHIRDHEKFQELQEMQYLQENVAPDSPQPGMGTLRGKDRF